MKFKEIIIHFHTYLITMALDHPIWAFFGLIDIKNAIFSFFYIS